MNYKELERLFIDHTSTQYEGLEAKSIFMVVLSHLPGWNNSQYLMHQQQEVGVETFSYYEDVMDKLRKGMPIQHIIGETLFYHLRFLVSPDVLIPRPETEELVHWILSTVNVYSKPKSVLDIGTGSGCIAIALKDNLPDSKVHALDVSTEALAIAQANAKLNNVDVTFIHEDILHFEGLDKYDLIVSNPPYITPPEKLGMHHNVLAHEPHLALFVTEQNPLIFYESIADFAIENLEIGGLLFFEINENFGRQMLAMLSSKGFGEMTLKKDMQGKDRMICCKRIHINGRDSLDGN